MSSLTTKIVYEKRILNGTSPTYFELQLTFGDFHLEYPDPGHPRWQNPEYSFSSEPSGWLVIDEILRPYAMDGVLGASVYEGTFEVPKYLDVKMSSNTIGWFSSQGAGVAGVALTKSKPPTNRPKKPTYHLPRLFRGKAPVEPGPVFLLVIPPKRQRFEGQPEYDARIAPWVAAKKRREERLTQVAMAKYRQKRAVYDRKVVDARRMQAEYDSNFAKRMDRYHLNMVKYHERVAKAAKPRFVQAPAAVLEVMKDNPYGRITAEITGELIYTSSDYQRVEDWRQWLVPYPEHEHLVYQPGGNGLWYGFLDTGTQKYIPQVAVSGRFITTAKPLDRSLHKDSIGTIMDALRQRVFRDIEPALTQLDSKCRRKIHQKLKGQVVHVGNMIAERQQTFDLVQSTFKRIYQLIKLKKNIFKATAEGLKNSKQLASDVLAFKFGVEPLVNDIQGFIKYIDETSDNPLIIARSNSGKLGSNSITFENSLFKFAGHVEISYVIKCRLDNPAARLLSQFGLGNIAEIAWEVTPWSFVVDWVFPVGNWIASQTADCGLTMVTGTRKVRLFGDFSIKNSPESRTLARLDGNEVGVHGDFKASMINRIVLTDLPGVPLPVVKNPWSWSHAIEGIALAVQRLR